MNQKPNNNLQSYSYLLSEISATFTCAVVDRKLKVWDTSKFQSYDPITMTWVRTQVCGNLQWLLCVTVALNWSITLHILLIWHHLTMFCSPTWTKNHCPGEMGLPLSVFQAVHKMSLVLFSKSWMVYPVWVYLEGNNAVSIRKGWI